MPPPEALDLSSALSGGTLLEAAAMVLGFVALLFVMSLVLPGRRVTGPDADGNERVYKLNGLSLYLIVMIAACGAQASGILSLSVLHTHILALFVVANGFAFALSGWLYLRGVRKPHASPRSWRDFFYGVDAAPAWLGLDLKLFSYCPSLIGLALFNASFAAVQYETYGELTPGDDALPGLHLPLRAQLLPVRAGDDPHLGHPSRALRVDAGLGRLRAGALLLLSPRLVAGSRTGAAVSGRRRRDRRALRFRLLALSRLEPAKAPLQAQPPTPGSGASPPGPWTGACWSPDSGASGGISTIPARSASISRSPSPPGLPPGLPSCCRHGWPACCGTARDATSAAAAPNTARCGSAIPGGRASRCCRSSIEAGDGKPNSQSGCAALGSVPAALGERRSHARGRVAAARPSAGIPEGSGCHVEPRLARAWRALPLPARDPRFRSLRRARSPRLLFQGARGRAERQGRLPLHRAHLRTRRGLRHLPGDHVGATGLSLSGAPRGGHAQVRPHHVRRGAAVRRLPGQGRGDRSAAGDERAHGQDRQPLPDRTGSPRSGGRRLCRDLPRPAEGHKHPGIFPPQASRRSASKARQGPATGGGALRRDHGGPPGCRGQPRRLHADAHERPLQERPRPQRRRDHGESC